MHRFDGVASLFAAGNVGLVGDDEESESVGLQVAQ